MSRDDHMMLSSETLNDSNSADEDNDGHDFGYSFDDFCYNDDDYDRESEGEDLPEEVVGIEFCPIDCPRLTDMASFTVASALCNHANTENYSRKLEVLILINQLPIPESISKCIAEYVSSIYDQSEDWLTYLKFKIFTGGRKRICKEYILFQHIVWYPHGRINVKQTVRNLVNSSKIRDFGKYRLLCAFCLKNELESMWPSFVLNNVFDYDVKVWAFLYYWHSYFGYRGAKFELERNQAIERFMFENGCANNWQAKEYFFDLMASEEQIQAMIWSLDLCDAKLQKALLRKLNENQRLQVYTNRAVKIISNYAAESPSFALDIRSTWFIVRNLVTPDDFVSIYKCILEFDGTPSEDIWFSASDDFKNHLLNQLNNRREIEIIDSALRLLVNENDIFYKMLSKSSAIMRRNITMESFFIQRTVDLIRDDKLPSFDRLLNFCFIEPEDRKQFKRNLLREGSFLQHCEKLIIEDKLKLLGQLLNLFLPKEEELTKFKQDLLINSKEIKDYCLRFYTNEKEACSLLNNFLTSLLPSSSSSDIIAEYKKNLLMSSEGMSQCISIINSQINLNPIINDSLPTSDLVAEFKERLVFSPAAVDKFRELIVGNRLNELDVCIDRYISSDEARIALKKKLIGDPIDLMYDVFRNNSDETSWQSFMMWWLRDEAASIDFKSCLPLDEIFNEMLKRCIYSNYTPRLKYCELRSDLRFDSLDRFLNWYFESSIKITQYKLQRIDVYVEIDAINTLLNGKVYGRSRDSVYLQKIFNWIFENNSQQIAKFKEKKNGEYNGEQIIKAIEFAYSNKMR